MIFAFQIFLTISNYAFSLKIFRFADEEQAPNSLTSTTSSTTSSGSVDSQKNGGRALYDDTLMVIEKSNHELEQKLNYHHQSENVKTNLVRPLIHNGNFSF